MRWVMWASLGAVLAAGTGCGGEDVSGADAGAGGRRAPRPGAQADAGASAPDARGATADGAGSGGASGAGGGASGTGGSGGAGSGGAGTGGAGTGGAGGAGTGGAGTGGAGTGGAGTGGAGGSGGSTSTELCSLAHLDGRCQAGARCVQGSCISSGCPDWHCTGAACAEITAMPGSHDPSSMQAMMDGYYIATETRYAYLRRDLTMLVQYAACEMIKKFPAAAPIGLSDMTQMDGLTPGTDAGSPRHPTTTHKGNDIDIAYYQTDGTNDPQIICGDGSDRNANGVAGRFNDGSFCTVQTNIIDWDREMWWFAKLAETPLVRVFGVDQTLPQSFFIRAAALLQAQEISTEVRARMVMLGYGAAGGWQFHHHHSHMSYTPPSTMALPGDLALEPLPLR